MEEFMLIFRHEDGSKLASPEQMQHWMKQTMDWIGGIASQNKFVGANGLPLTMPGSSGTTIQNKMEKLWVGRR